MKIILIERLANLGNVGDTLTVKDGYARNYLIPQKKALRATKSNVEYFEAKRSEIVARNDQQHKNAEAAAKSFDNNVVVTLIRASGDDGRLFGSVSARDIAAALQEKKHPVERQHVVLLNPIKEIGIFTVKIALHPEVEVSVKVNVARSESEADAAWKAANAPKQSKAKAAAEEAFEEVTAEEATDEDAA